MMYEKYKKYIESVYLIIIIVLIGITYVVETNKKPEIINFIESRGEKNVSIKRRYVFTGPFFPDKNTRIYYVISSKNIYWFRFNWIQHDCVYLEENGQYVELK